MHSLSGLERGSEILHYEYARYEMTNLNQEAFGSEWNTVGPRPCECSNTKGLG